MKACHSLRGAIDTTTVAPMLHLMRPLSLPLSHVFKYPMALLFGVIVSEATLDRHHHRARASTDMP